jgi:6-phosphogluconolactonase
VNAGLTPVALVSDPAGKFLFVANQGTSSDVTSGTISVFAISGTNLTPVGNPVPTEQVGEVSGSGPSGLAVSPVGSFLYVANQFSNNVQSYSYDASGNLALIASYTAGTNPTSLAFSRCAGVASNKATANCTVGDGNNLFVSNSGSNNISIFSACIQVSATCGIGGVAPDGTLTEIPSKSPVPAGVAPATILINRTSDFVYAVDRGSNQVSEYQYSPATGVLTPLASSSGGASVFSGGITSNIADNSKTFNWVAVTNNGSSSLSVFQVVATGKLITPNSGQYAVQGQPSAILLR